MKIAYGYNRPVGAFDHTSPDRVYIDTEKTDRSARTDMFKAGGIRERDTLILFKRGDLAQGDALRHFESALASMNVTVILIYLPASLALSQGGRPVGTADLDDLTDDDDKAIKIMWKDPLIYTPKYCLKWASDKLGKPVKRYQLDYRYGKRNDDKERD